MYMYIIYGVNVMANILNLWYFNVSNIHMIHVCIRVHRKKNQEEAFGERELTTG